MSAHEHDEQTPARPRTRTALVAEYRRDYPLYDRYQAIIERYNRHDGPITEPSTSPGYDCHTAAALALAELGRPDDKLAAMMAYAFVLKLDEEIDSLAEKQAPTIGAVLIGYFFQLAPYLPAVDEWNSWAEEDQLGMMEELAAQLPAEVLPGLLRVAMPSLLAHAITEDEKTRGRSAAWVDGLIRAALGPAADEDGAR